MRHEYFAVRIRKQIEAADRPSVSPTFSAGDFAPDLVNRLKQHLRKVELAQINAVQEYKETIRTSSHSSGRLKSSVQRQIEAARRNYK